MHLSSPVGLPLYALARRGASISMVRLMSIEVGLNEWMNVRDLSDAVRHSQTVAGALYNNY